MSPHASGPILILLYPSLAVAKAKVRPQTAKLQLHVPRNKEAYKSEISSLYTHETTAWRIANTTSVEHDAGRSANDPPRHSTRSAPSPSRRTRETAP